MAKQAVVEFSHIEKSFGNNKVLTDINLSVFAGECFAIMGENGAGKSTLMKILSGAYSMDNGLIKINGQAVHITNPSSAKELGIFTIYQELSFIPTLSVVENLFLGMLPVKKGLIDWEKAHEEAKRILKTIHVEIDPNTVMRDLTSAQRQMIEIARAILWKAKVIIMDEPTSSLSAKETEVLFSIVKEFKENGLTTIFISHKIDEVFRICDRVAVLKDGVLTGLKSINETTKNEIVNLMVGRELKDYYPSRKGCLIGDICLEAKDISSRNGIRNISFSAKHGEILGFAGLVGSGRTEVMRTIFGADKMESGVILINGKPVSIRQPADAINHGIALATEDRRFQGLVMKLSVSQNLTLACLNKIRSGIRIDRGKENSIVNKNIENLKIKCQNSTQSVKELSGGNQQKIIVGKWMNTEAEIYIFDEPTKGIDIGAKAEIYQLMDQLARKGKCIIMVSSELPEILGISDTIIVMSEGRITAKMSRAEATEAKIMAYSIGGDAQ